MKQQSPIVAIEICRSQLQAVILRPQASGSEWSIHTRSIEWRHEAPSLTSELGAKELTAAFKQLIAEERIGGQKISLCLNGDFCVTRAVTGTTNDVRRELGELEERSSLYLSLGTGPKALATSIRQIDARHQHALLTVTNKRVLDTVVQVAAQVNLEIDRIEPSLVALSRLMAQAGRDAEPVMLIALSEGSVELGISHQGHLLLDYRPGGRSTTEEVADIAERHLARLERYCQRYMQMDQHRLQRVILCGMPDAVAAAKRGFARHQNLRVEVLDPMQVDPDWQFGDTRPDSQMGAALGSALVAQKPETPGLGPNLMERLLAEARERLWPALWRSAWPVAAALLIAVGLLAADAYQKLKCNELSNQLADLAPAQAKIADLQEKMSLAENMIHHLQGIRRALSNPAWDKIVTTIGRCMPEDVWLENLASNATGRLTLTGASYGQDGVYEFVRWLQKTPGLTEVALEQTHPATLATGPATGFDLSAEFAGQGTHSGKGK